MLGEVLGDDEHGVALPRLELGQGGAPVGERPIELVVHAQLVNDEIAHVELAGQLARTARVLVHHANAQVARVVVWIPEAHDVVPGVYRRQDEQCKHHHEGWRHMEQAQDIALEHAQNVPHALPPPFRNRLKQPGNHTPPERKRQASGAF